MLDMFNLQCMKKYYDLKNNYICYLQYFYNICYNYNL